MEKFTMMFILVIAAVMSLTSVIMAAILVTKRQYNHKAFVVVERILASFAVTSFLGVIIFGFGCGIPGFIVSICTCVIAYACLDVLAKKQRSETVLNYMTALLITLPMVEICLVFFWVITGKYTQTLYMAGAIAFVPMISVLADTAITCIKRVRRDAAN